LSIFSVLSSSYASSTQNLIPTGAKFANVDSKKYQGTWTGKDVNGKFFSLVITNVKGYRANVLFKSAIGIQNARVFIATNNSFRIGDSSFVLTGNGTAQVNTVIIDATTGIQTIEKSPAVLKA
jgi:hypothetical protein